MIFRQARRVYRQELIGEDVSELDSLTKLYLLTHIDSLLIFIVSDFSLQISLRLHMLFLCCVDVFL